MSFVRYDLGKGQPNRDKGDCTVRALATASGMSYERAYALLYELQGVNHHCAFRIFDYLRNSPHSLGVIRAFKYRAVRGVPRMKARDFAAHHPVGRYILRLAHHSAAVVDGNIIDTWDCSGKCVYGAWEIKKA